MFPIYVINLDRRPDRLRSIIDQLDRLGLKALRVQALDGERATSKDFEPFVSFDGWARRRDMDLATAACIVSHRNALVRFLRETDAPAALMLEDDVKLASDLPDFLTAAERTRSVPGLLKLDVYRYHRKGPQRPLGLSVGTIGGRQLHPIASWAPGAAAYVVTRNVAELILQHCYHITEDFDVVIFDLRKSRLARRLRPILVQPAVAYQLQEVFTSDILEYRRTAARTSPQRQLAASFRKLPRRTFVAWNLATGQMKRARLRFADRV